jgi:hypothetical protein
MLKFRNTAVFHFYFGATKAREGHPLATNPIDRCGITEVVSPEDRIR